MRTQEPSQVLELEEHLDAASRFDDTVLEALRVLAAQLSDKSVLPLIGAGGSVDCGMRLARDLGVDLLADYLGDPRYAPHATDLDPNLGDVADEIYLTAGQQGVVEALRLPDETLWPPASAIGDHFCAYRVLARLSRETLFADAVTLNYDCGYEAGLRGEGFALEPDVRPGQVFPDHVTIMADPRSANSVSRKGSLVLRKIHGCAERYRLERQRDPTSSPEDAIIVRRSQLQGWGGRMWARDWLRVAAQGNVIVLIGFSAQDPIIAGELTQLLKDAYEAQGASGDPRIVVIDHTPCTQALRTLVHHGLGSVAADAGKVCFVETSKGTTTAALLVLLAELLAHCLEPALKTASYALPTETDERLAALVLAAPIMLRWSYLLCGSGDPHLLQRGSLHEAAQRGYVPLRVDPETTARALHRRATLRAALGHPSVEGTSEVLAGQGFVVDAKSGRAYLPTGRDADALAGACRPGGPLHDARHALPYPKLECIIVANDHRGFTLRKGQEVTVP